MMTDLGAPPVLLSLPEVRRKLAALGCPRRGPGQCCCGNCLPWGTFPRFSPFRALGDTAHRRMFCGSLRERRVALAVQMQLVPTFEGSEAEALEPESGSRIRKGLAGAGLLGVVVLCWVALQAGPGLLARYLGAPALVEGQPEPQQAFLKKVMKHVQKQREARWAYFKSASDIREQKEAHKTWHVLDGKALRFQQKPRVRREWRTLSERMKQKVADAFWTVKTLTTEEGQKKYGPNFHNHDDMLMLHSCATTDPRCVSDGL